MKKLLTIALVLAGVVTGLGQGFGHNPGGSSGGGAPSGAAGGVLGGTYPDPSFAVDMATQAELNALSGTYQPLDTDLTTWAAITPSANVISLNSAANYAAIRTLLGLVPGTNVQAYDTDLTTWGAITPSANVVSLNSAADYAAIRTLLSLVVGTNVQAYDGDLTTYAGITPSANVQSVLSAADYSAIRTLLGLVIGTNVQAYDGDLTTYAGITPSANVQSVLGSADYAAIKSLLTLGSTDTPTFGALTLSSNVAAGTAVLSVTNTRGSAGGQVIKANAATGYTGNLFDGQLNAVTKFNVTQTGNVKIVDDGVNMNFGTTARAIHGQSYGLCIGGDPYSGPAIILYTPTNVVSIEANNLQPWTDDQGDIGAASYRWKKLFMGKTIVAPGTTGAATINYVTGRVNFAAAATSLVVTDSRVDANSIINCTIATNDATAANVKAVAGAGTFTIYLGTAPTAETAVNFFFSN